MVIRSLKILGWIVGLALIALGAGRIALPVETIPGSTGRLTASLDSETRAGGVLLVGLGFAYIWAVRQPQIPVTLLRALSTIMGALAFSRLISAVAVGMPHPIFAAAAVAETVAAALTLWYSTMSPNPPAAGVG